MAMNTDLSGSDINYVISMVPRVVIEVLTKGICCRIGR